LDNVLPNHLNPKYWAHVKYYQFDNPELTSKRTLNSAGSMHGHHKKKIKYLNEVHVLLTKIKQVHLLLGSVIHTQDLFKPDGK